MIGALPRLPAVLWVSERGEQLIGWQSALSSDSSSVSLRIAARSVSSCESARLSFWAPSSQSERQSSPSVLQRRSSRSNSCLLRRSLSSSCLNACSSLSTFLCAGAVSGESGRRAWRELSCTGLVLSSANARVGRRN